MSNEIEFNKSLKIIGDLYEEGKDCLNSLSIIEREREYYHRLFEILQEMRNRSAETLQKLHGINES